MNGKSGKVPSHLEREGQDNGHEHHPKDTGSNSAFHTPHSALTYAVVLAAGRGSRMAGEGGPTNFPKVLRQACGRPLIRYVLDALGSAGVTDITVIIGFGADQLLQELGDSVGYVFQSEQLGSGHAVACAAPKLAAKPGIAVIMCGDSPLFTPATIQGLLETLDDKQARIALASAVLDDPTGYGRIIRDEHGNITRIVEQKGASEEDLAVKEVNGGCYAFDSEWLWANIGRMEKNPAGELNLTDLVRVAISDGEKVAASPCEPQEMLGVNTPADLAEIERVIGCR